MEMLKQHLPLKAEPDNLFHEEVTGILKVHAYLEASNATTGKLFQ